MSGFSEATEDVEVEYVDQQRICEFGRNANRLAELSDESKELQAKLDKLEDAEQEIMLGDGDEGSVRLHIGEVFTDVSEDFMTEYMERKRESHAASQAEMSKEADALNARQEELKKLLYKKFGNNINLEA